MNNIFFLDFETTGLNVYLDDIIEIAIKKQGKDEGYQTLVIPSKITNGIYTYVPPFISDLTKITDDMISKKGIDKNTAIYQTYKFIKENIEDRGPIYIVSHNGHSFDFLIFKRLIDNYQKSIPGIEDRIIRRFKYIDTVLLCNLFMKKQNYGQLKQSSLCKKYNIINENEHRALGDILALEKLYEHLCIDYAIYNHQDESYYLDHPDKIELYIN
tara:strand:- start:880 stop:1521 length:642 start_codon:yes stop_codon:yes gene_type:complete